MWTKAKQIDMHTKVYTEAETLAKKLGANCVYIVAHFIDQEGNLHSMRGGQLPMPETEFYRRQLMLYSRAEVEETMPTEGKPN